MSEATPQAVASTRRYITAVALLGVPVLAAAGYGAAAGVVADGWGGPSRVALTLGLASAAYLVLKSLILFDWRGQRVALAPDEVLVFVALVALPLPWTVLFALPAMAAYQAVTKRDLHRGAFNVSVLLIASGAAALAAWAASALQAPTPLAALVGIAVYTPVNLLLVSGVFATREGSSIFTVFRERFAVPSLIHFGLGSSIGLTVVALWSYHPAAVLALGPVVYFARSHVQLIARTDRESVVHKRLAEVSHTLVGEPNVEVVANRVLETCGEIFHAGRVTLTISTPTGKPRTWRRDDDAGFDPGRRPLAVTLPGRADAPLGAITIHPVRDTHQEFTVADHALLSVVAGEAAASLEHAQVLQDLDASRRALLSTRVARPLVKRIVRALVEEMRADASVLMRVGQGLARGADVGQVADDDVETLCHAYEGMGLGSLALDDQRGAQYTFTGHDLFERSPGAGSTTCYLALGFLTGVVSRAHPRAKARGTEVACESRGAPECRFVVQVKDA